jgi:hypothetical protein
MEFLKKNYEKVILSVVLLGLAVAAALLLKQVADEKVRLDEIRRLNLTTAPKDLEPTDVSTNLATLARVQRPTPVVLQGTNNLFNPVQWRKLPDDRLVKMATGNEIGPGALQILTVRPLYLRISYEGESGSGDTTQYKFRIEREAEKTAGARRPETLSFTSVGRPNKGMLLREMRPPEKPTEFVLELLDSKTQVLVSAGKPYERVAGYTADLRYESINWKDRRIEDRLMFAGDTNKIVAITETNVTVEASNRKRTTVIYNPLSQPASQ